MGCYGAFARFYTSLALAIDEGRAIVSERIWQIGSARRRWRHL